MTFQLIPQDAVEKKPKSPSELTLAGCARTR